MFICDYGERLQEVPLYSLQTKLKSVTSRLGIANQQSARDSHDAQSCSLRGSGVWRSAVPVPPPASRLYKPPNSQDTSQRRILPRLFARSRCQKDKEIRK